VRPPPGGRGRAARPGGGGGLPWRPARPAGPALAQVLAPTLLIVGGADTSVLALNREATGRLTAPHRLEVVPVASHLFPEPGAEGGRPPGHGWFLDHLVQRPTSPSGR
jgi:putative phosphoribosyl transferase